jgi:hypothetical protein
VAALVDALHSLVSGERELLGEAVDPGLVPDPEPQGLGPLARRRHALGQRGGGHAHEPARGEDGERARPLADEVRRGGEARLPADAPRGQITDVLLPHQPADRFRHVARVGVLGNEHGEPSAQALVQGREDDRKRRLGDAGALRQRLGERDEALVLDELGQQRMEGRTVHDERPKRPLRGRSV